MIFLADTEANIAIIVPLTSNLQALRFPHTIEVKPTNVNGLAVDSIALVFQVRAIDKKRFQKKIGKAHSSTINELNRILKKLLGI